MFSSNDYIALPYFGEFVVLGPRGPMSFGGKFSTLEDAGLAATVLRIASADPSNEATLRLAADRWGFDDGRAMYDPYFVDHVAAECAFGSLDMRFMSAAELAAMKSVLGNPRIHQSTGVLSPRGIEFLYAREALEGVSNKLHYPGGASGVTLGPGYDMGGRKKADIKETMLEIGLSDTIAEAISEAAGKKSGEASKFCQQNKNLVMLTPAQEQKIIPLVVPPFEQNVRLKVKVSINQNQFDALVSFCYNIGIGAFNGSGALKTLNENKIYKVGEKMKQWNKIKVDGESKVSQGLKNRRALEVELFYRED